MTTDEAFEKWLESDAAPDWIESKHARVGWCAAKADSAQGMMAQRAYIEALTKTHERKIAELQAHINRLLEGLHRAKSMLGNPDSLDVIYEYLNGTPAQSLKAHDDDIYEKCAEIVNMAGQGFCGSNVEIVFNSAAESIRKLKGE